MDGFEVHYWYDDEEEDAGPSTASTSPTELSQALGVDGVSFLGRGSFGETWAVRDDPAGKLQRAVKVILDPDYPPALLSREVEGVRRVNHPNVVRFLDHIEIPLSSGKHPALVFEYVPGGDLSAKMATTTFSSEQVWEFGVGLLGAVTALHETGTVHRDIKPQNIALRGGKIASPVLLDLGLSKMLDGDSVTKYPSLLGTLPFMAPEQVRWEPARKGADVWAVGVVLYLMLSGRHPFFGPRSQAKTTAEALAAFHAGPPPLPGSVPDALRETVLRMLSENAYSRGSAARRLAALTEEH